jgi:intein/homing endonuclease
MKELSRNEKLAYLIGLFDGEECLGINIEKDQRKHFISEALKVECG